MIAAAPATVSGREGFAYGRRNSDRSEVDVAGERVAIALKNSSAMTR
jgi:hypothetical protein